MHPPLPLSLCRPRRLNISPHPLLPYPREFSGITDYTTAEDFDIIRPGASGKSRTGDCELLGAVLDTFPAVYNP